MNEFFTTTQQYLGALNQRPEISMAYSTFDVRYPQWTVEVDAAKCKRAGITPDAVLSTLSGYYGGQYVSNFNRFSKVYRVMIQADPVFRLDETSLDNAFVRMSNGEMAPLSQFVTLTRSYGAESLSRFNMYNSIAVNAMPADGYSTGDAIKAVQETAEQSLPKGYGYDYGGITREENQQSGTTIIIFGICFLMIYLILSALYESFIIPFAVLLSVPCGLMDRFAPLEGHFNRYLMIGGFPELVLSDDDVYAQRMLREDVVDKVIKRDVLTLFNIRSPLLMEKLFLYLCMNSTETFSVTTAAKELENTSASTIDSYIEALEMSNLIYLSKPMNVGSKGALKGKPKIYIADAAIRNAVLMIDDVLSDERELGAMVETTVYKHIVSFYQGSTAQLGYFRKAKDNQKEVDVVIELPCEKILCEVKYRNNSHIPATDALVELCKDESAKVTSAFLITKQLDDFGIAKHETQVPILRVPAIAFLYLLGKAEADGQNGKM